MCYSVDHGWPHKRRQLHKSNHLPQNNVKPSTKKQETISLKINIKWIAVVQFYILYPFLQFILYRISFCNKGHLYMTFTATRDTMVTSLPFVFQYAAAPNEMSHSLKITTDCYHHNLLYLGMSWWIGSMNYRKRERQMTNLDCAWLRCPVERWTRYISTKLLQPLGGRILHELAPQAPQSWRTLVSRWIAESFLSSLFFISSKLVKVAHNYIPINSLSIYPPHPKKPVTPDHQEKIGWHQWTLN